MGKTSLLLLGTGFIGGSVLAGLLDEGKYDITALSRSDEKAKKLHELGVKTIKGSLDDEIIVKATKEHDIILHAATADDAPSVRSILKGLSERPQDGPAAIYIHTSGTGVLCSTPDPDVIYSDKNPEQIDELTPDSAWHRDVDNLIRAAVKDGSVGKAKVAIMLPPTIYGIGLGPLNKLSIDIPIWIKESIKNEQVTIYGPESALWEDISIKNLVPAYITLLNSLIKAPAQPEGGLYYFAETGTHSWHELGRKLHEVLSARGLVKKEPRYDDRPAEGAAMGTVSRSKSERLKELGWKADAETKSIYESVEEEVEAVLKL